MTQDAPGRSYTLDNTWDKAHQRLRCLEREYDRGTIEHLERLGVGPGWRCLELGAGAGSVARWLADTVGPSGQVTAVDIEPRFLLADPHPNLTVDQRNIVIDGLPGGDWDLIHTRFLLMHLDTRDSLLSTIASALRPGGVALLEEGDCFPIAAASSSLYIGLWDAAITVAAKAGGDWYWGRTLPALREAAGTVEVRAHADVRWFAAGSPWATLMELTMEQLSPVMLADGVPAGLIADSLAELRDPGRWFPAPAIFPVEARAPRT